MCSVCALKLLRFACQLHQVFNFLWQVCVCVCVCGIWNLPVAQLSTILCTRLYAHTLAKTTLTKANRAMLSSAVLSSATLCHMVLCCFSHMQLRSRWRMGEEEKTTVVMDGRPHSFECHWTIQWEQEELCVCMHLSTYTHLDPLRIELMTTVCQYGLTVGILPLLRLLDPKTEDKAIKQPISMMVAILMWMILSSSVCLHKMWPWGHTDSK